VPGATSGLTAVDTSTGTPLSDTSQAYTGPVAGVAHQYINITSDSLSVTTSTDGWFLHSGPGTDAMAVHGGNNILDGGTGSNFLTGGSGTDTFFVDARNATADIWSTLVNFHAGDSATLWGVSAADFALQWQDGQGATGFTGLTLHATSAGKPTATLTLVGFSQGDIASGRISTSFGTDPASGSSYLYIHANS
jgi:Ca2+-binding RTX toxin-like protein